MSGGPVFQLAERLDLRAAGSLATALLDLRGADLVLDAGHTQHIGALSAQVIRSAARSWAEDGHALRLDNVSTDLVDQIVLLGFTPETLTAWEDPR